MAQTYPTIATFTAGQTLTAATMNDIRTWLANQRVPPVCVASRATNLSAYSSGTAITWDNKVTDTDATMFTASSATITINTTGLYYVECYIYLTCLATLTAMAPTVRVGGNNKIANYLAAASTGSGAGVANGILSLTAGNTVDAVCYANGGSAYVIGGGATSDASTTSRLSVAWIGQTA